MLEGQSFEELSHRGQFESSISIRFDKLKIRSFFRWCLEIS